MLMEYEEGKNNYGSQGYTKNCLIKTARLSNLLQMILELHIRSRIKRYQRAGIMYRGTAPTPITTSTCIPDSVTIKANVFERLIDSPKQHYIDAIPLLTPYPDVKPMAYTSNFLWLGLMCSRDCDGFFDAVGLLLRISAKHAEVQQKSNLTTKNLKRLDPWLLLKYSRDSFRCSSSHGFICDTLMQHMESVKKSIDERAHHKQEYDSWVNERQMQITEEKVDTSKALDDSLVDTKSSGTESKEQDTSSRSGNDAHADDADIRPIYDEEPMAEVQTIAKINVFAIGQQHTEQPEFNNKGEVAQNVEQCHDTCPLPAKLTDNQNTKLSYQSLESKNICLKKTVAQFQKDFLRMEAHCVNLELKYQNQALKEGQHGQFLKVKSNEAKIKHDIEVIEIINIELEHKVAKLLKENENLKKNYKELYDSIKTTRVKNIEYTTSLIAKNDDFKAQLQKKGFAIAALKK
ncbi:hypothetical protein Tco_0520271 [Tanacetum coccineum]